MGFLANSTNGRDHAAVATPLKASLVVPEILANGTVQDRIQNTI